MKSIVLILFIILIVQNLCAKDINDPLFNRIKGDWASQHWVLKLIKSRSPRDAMWNSASNIMAFFKKEENHYVVSIAINGFHEGYERSFTTIMPKKSNHFDLLHCQQNEQEGNVVVDTSYIGKIIFLGSKKAHIQIGGTFSLNDTMIRTRSKLDEFVNENTLAGEYVDSLGNKYTFTAEGIIFWVNNKYKYWILLDYVLEQNDILYIEKENAKEPWIFEWKDEKLFLFHTTRSRNHEGYEKSGKPLVLCPLIK